MNIEITVKTIIVHFVLFAGVWWIAHRALAMVS